MNPGSHLVTVVITTCKRDPSFVSRALNSLLRQTYSRLEILVVDDSPEGYSQKGAVREAVERVKGLSHNARYISYGGNRGAQYARNTGLKEANGDYIAFLDDDDEWLPEKIEKQLAAFENETAMVYCDYCVIDEINQREYSYKRKVHSGRVYDSLLEFNFIGGTSVPLIRKKCLIEIGGFDETLRSAQDYDMFLRLAKKYEIVHVCGEYVKYYVHKGARVTTNAQAKISGRKRLIEKYETELDANPRARVNFHSCLIIEYKKTGNTLCALQVWAGIVRRKPWDIWRNTKNLAHALIHVDSWIFVQYRKFRHMLEGWIYSYGQE